jgi:hypothetical protein
MAVTISGAATYPVTRPPTYAPPSVPVPEYSGAFIPTLWSSSLVEKFYDASIMPAISNSNYEGEIKQQGDHVVIRQRPSITIKPYYADSKLDVERPSAPTVELLIDMGWYWNLACDDVFEIQSDIAMMDIWATDASEQFRIVVDRDCLDYAYSKVLVAQALTGNYSPWTALNAPYVAGGAPGTSGGRISKNINLGVTGTPIQLTYSGTGPTAPAAVKQDIMDFILRISQVMDENNLPQAGRFIVLPSWAIQMLKASDLRMANEMGDSTSVYRNGQVGTLDRMSVYSSNLLPAGVMVAKAGTPPALPATAAVPAVYSTLAANEHVIFAGITNGLTFASQITKVETLRSESSFANLMRGLQVYGRELVDPKSLVAAVVKQ